MAGTRNSTARREAELDFDRELSMRVARARQTLDFAAKQRCRFAQLSHGRMTVWRALATLDELPQCALHAVAFLSLQWHVLLLMRCADWVWICYQEHDHHRTGSTSACEHRQFWNRQCSVIFAVGHAGWHICHFYSGASVTNTHGTHDAYMLPACSCGVSCCAEGAQHEAMDDCE